MKFTVTVIVFIATFLFVVSFMSIDSCMDAGGIWSRFGFSCHGAREGFVPQYQRPIVAFWLFVTVLSGVVAFIANKIMLRLWP